MRLFILMADHSVEVEDIASEQTAYISATCPKGQIFIRGLFSWSKGWHCLHRGDLQWRIANKVPEEVLLAEMIVN
jgi:hypothetical protein